MKTAEGKAGIWVEVPGILRVKWFRGMGGLRPYAQYQESDEYVPFHPRARSAETEALWMALDKARENGESVALAGGNWGDTTGCVTHLSEHPAGSDVSQVALPVVKFQFDS